MSEETVSFKAPEPRLTLFDATRDDLPEVVLVNEALLSFRHTEVFPWHLALEIDYIETADNEMPTPEESERLNEIGDQIETIVLGGRNEFGAPNALFLARSTWNRIRELVFRVHDPEIAHAALQELLTSEQWKREWEYKMSHDPEWSEAGFWFQLFPIAEGNDA